MPLRTRSPDGSSGPESFYLKNYQLPEPPPHVPINLSLSQADRPVQISFSGVPTTSLSLPETQPRTLRETVLCRYESCPVDGAGKKGSLALPAASQFVGESLG